MTLSLEQFETQWAENRLSVTDWFDTTYGLFKELEALKSTTTKHSLKLNKELIATLRSWFGIVNNKRK